MYPHSKLSNNIFMKLEGKKEHKRNKTFVVFCDF